MGCDIHCYAEKKVNGKWEKISGIFKYRYYNPERPTTVDEDGYVNNSEFDDHPYSGRNYDLFGILADVRNGRGFAGVKTGEGFNPIAQPKGLPEDVSIEVQKESDRWDGDGHSHSYFTIKELLEFNWNQLSMKQGWVDKKEYQSYLENGVPDSWCGGVIGPNVLHVPNSDILTEDLPSVKKYTSVQWGTTYRATVGETFFESIKKLQEFGADEDVRIVFWFDN